MFKFTEDTEGEMYRTQYKASSPSITLIIYADFNQDLYCLNEHCKVKFLPEISLKRQTDTTIQFDKTSCSMAKRELRQKCCHFFSLISLAWVLLTNQDLLAQ